MTNGSDVYADQEGQPEPPVNVRIQYMDGGEDPVELTYEGQDGNGFHVWVAVPTSPLISTYATLKVDRLPAMTAIHLQVDEPS